jgi:hypothetical protein
MATSSGRTRFGRPDSTQGEGALVRCAAYRRQAARMPAAGDGPGPISKPRHPPALRAEGSAARPQLRCRCARARPHRSMPDDAGLFGQSGRALVQFQIMPTDSSAACGPKGQEDVALGGGWRAPSGVRVPAGLEGGRPRCASQCRVRTGQESPAGPRADRGRVTEHYGVANTSAAPTAETRSNPEARPRYPSNPKRATDQSQTKVDKFPSSFGLPFLEPHCPRRRRPNGPRR